MILVAATPRRSLKNKVVAVEPVQHFQNASDTFTPERIKDCLLVAARHDQISSRLQRPCLSLWWLGLRLV